MLPVGIVVGCMVLERRGRGGADSDAWVTWYQPPVLFWWQFEWEREYYRNLTKKVFRTLFQTVLHFFLSAPTDFQLSLAGAEPFPKIKPKMVQPGGKLRIPSENWSWQFFVQPVFSWNIR